MPPAGWKKGDQGVDYEQATGQSVDDGHFINRLVHALENNATANTSGPKPLSAAERNARAQAFASMEALIEKHKASDIRPRYRLATEQFIGDELIPATRVTGQGQVVATVIRFEGIPNETMHPLDEPARKVHELYMRSIGGQTPDLADISMDAYKNRPGRVQVEGAPVAPPPLGLATKTAKAELVDEEESVYPIQQPNQLGTVPQSPARV